MNRRINENDRSVMLDMFDEFYHSPGVMHAVPKSHFERTLDEVYGGSPYVDCYIFEQDGKSAGYGQLSLTYSNEAGGICVWLEEIYVRPAFQGKGLGSEFLNFVKNEYKNAARLRLEIEPDNDGARKLYRRMGFSELEYQSMIIDKEI